MPLPSGRRKRFLHPFRSCRLIHRYLTNKLINKGRIIIDKSTRFQTRTALVGVCQVFLYRCLQTEVLYMGQLKDVEYGHSVGHTAVNLVA